MRLHVLLIQLVREGNPHILDFLACTRVIPECLDYLENPDVTRVMLVIEGYAI